MFNKSVFEQFSELVKKGMQISAGDRLTLGNNNFRLILK